MQKVLLGMSGGVDSSASAIILKEQGYEVIGTTMSLCPNGSCCNLEAYLDAKAVCKKLGIEHFIFEATGEFKKYVIDDFIDAYKKGLTPNPCIECNRFLKFGMMYEKAKQLGCDYVATGHYAKTEYSEKYERYVLKKSNEEKKDQTYFLYTMPKEEVEHIIFPLQEFISKQDTRKLVEENGLNVAKKRDSQEVCFVPDGDYKNFLKMNIKDSEIKKGNIVLKNGDILGRHEGIINYTIGQRKGLGISYKEPLYVVDLNTEKNEVIVGEEKDLYKKELYANKINWLAIDELKEPMKCYAKIRYRAKEALAIIETNEDGVVKVKFEKPQRAITKGQSVVFYDEDGVVIGGGIIMSQ